MISNLENLSEEQKNMVENTTKNIERLTTKVGPTIDTLGSAGLKRVLKAITHYSIAENIITGKKLKLKETEQMLIDHVFELQQEILGFIQLSNELGLTTQEGENDESTEMVE